MSTWLHPLRQALDQAPVPVRFFFRDDDAGWQDSKLYRLLDLFATYQGTLDLAVIPQALSESLAKNLRRAADNFVIGLHQHGFSHTNHEPGGRKYEFGPNRSSTQQRHDLQAGRKRLQALLGPALDPIFTPPWNRCTATTVECLATLGYQVLSRDATAAPLVLPSGLTEQPVSIDWLRRRNGVRVGRKILGQQLAAAAQNQGVIGVMLHHAVMEDRELENVRSLLRLLANHEQACCQLMRNLIEPKRATP